MKYIATLIIYGFGLFIYSIGLIVGLFILTGSLILSISIFFLYNLLIFISLFIMYE